MAKTGAVDCSKSIISLDFFGYFLALYLYVFSGIAECKHLFQDNCAAINEEKNNKQLRVKNYRGFEASEWGRYPKSKIINFFVTFCVGKK